jgi:hypothetical protein
MDNFFKKHPDLVLIGLAVVFVAILIVYFFWGITTLIVELNKGVNPGKINQSAVTFNLEDAAKLNLKGALQQ